MAPKPLSRNSADCRFPCCCAQTPSTRDGPDAGERPQAEVPGGNPTREKPRVGELEPDVSDLHLSDQLVLRTQIPDLDAVSGGELAILVVVDVHVEPLEDVARHVQTDLKVGRDPRQPVEGAGRLDRRIAGPEPGPVPAQLAATAEPELEARGVGLLGA